jgi:hypothetical protein
LLHELLLILDLKVVGSFAIGHDHAKGVLDELAGAEAVAADVSFGVDRDLALRRNDHFDHSWHSVLLCYWGGLTELLKVHPDSGMQERRRFALGEMHDGVRLVALLQKLRLGQVVVNPNVDLPWLTSTSVNTSSGKPVQFMHAETMAIVRLSGVVDMWFLPAGSLGL